MGISVTCAECGKLYDELQALEELRENESVCLRCGTPVAVESWDLLLVTWEEEPEEKDLELDLVEIDDE